MTYPPQQPENGWSDNQQQPQQPVDPFAQAAPGHQAQPVDPFGQPPQQYGHQQAHPQQQEYGQPQYAHDEIPTDQTQSYGGHQAQPQQEWDDADHTHVIGHGQGHHGQAVDPEHTQVLGQHQQQAPQYHEQQQVPQYQEQQQPPHPYQGQQYQQQPPQYGEHTQVLGQRRAQPPQPPIEENTQVIAQTSPIPPQHHPQAPVSASPAFGQPYGAPVSASPASGQPYGAPVSASPASGQPFGAPVSASPSAGQFSPYAETPPGVPASPFTPAPAIRPMSAAPASSQPWSPTPQTPQFSPKKRRGLPSWVYVVGVVVIVAALAVGAIVYFGVGDGAPEAKPTPTPTKEETIPLLTESSSGLGYTPMGDPWAELSQLPNLDQAGFSEQFSSFTGQYVLTDTDWMAVFLIGEIDPEAVDYEPNAIRGSVEKLATLMDEQSKKNIDASPLKDRVSGFGRDGEPVYTQLRVDGRSAGYFTYHVAWEDSGSNEVGSDVIVGVIDLGNGKLAGFVIDIPGTVGPALAESAKQAMNTLQFG